MSMAALLMLSALAQTEADEAPRSHVGSLHPFLQDYAGSRDIALSYLARDWPSVEEWQAQGRAKMDEVLAYHPEPAPADAEILASVQKDGYTRHHVRYSVTADRKTEAFLLIPDGLAGPAPAVMALHDHGGFYYFGKEKITDTENPPRILQEFIGKSYGGRTFADELARRGFVVLVPDAFYFGSQRLEPASLPDQFAKELQSLEPGTDPYISAFNRMAGRHEELTAKTIFTAGATWPGILFQGDRASLDYLLTRPEVDPERVGCMGLSIGGFRSAHLFGLDPRIKAGVVAGWMVTYPSLLFDHLLHHTWMIYVPGQLAWLDLPDVVTLNAPRPLMVINCALDDLFTMDGMTAADLKIAAVYEKMGMPDDYKCNVYQEPHSLKVPAQNDAIEWLEKALRPTAANQGDAG